MEVFTYNVTFTGKPVTCLFPCWSCHRCPVDNVLSQKETVTASAQAKLGAIGAFTYSFWAALEDQFSPVQLPLFQEASHRTALCQAATAYMSATSGCLIRKEIAWACQA